MYNNEYQVRCQFYVRNKNIINIIKSQYPKWGFCGVNLKDLVEIAELIQRIRNFIRDLHSKNMVFKWQ
ncbi:MAG: hypothetical protein ABS68_12060 [Niastella sp. SCN 39-18]|nr:MAG: hypothetical protein ABS68_12060 [Niastella sp. SCN 39-18]OJW09722.1 MAG: hypothetical protein BGO53_07665 [Sphingobacteriales bacterium 39-19]